MAALKVTSSIDLLAQIPFNQLVKLQIARTSSNSLPSGATFTLNRAEALSRTASTLNFRQQAFVDLCMKNKELIQSSKVFDGYLLALCFLFFERAQLRMHQYTTEKLFSAMYLAVAMEEDSEEGIHEVIVHKIGISKKLPALDYTNVAKRCWYESHTAWRKELNAFYREVNNFWHSLDFNTYASASEVERMLCAFSAECSLFHTRKQRQLDSLAPFW